MRVFIAVRVTQKIIDSAVKIQEKLTVPDCKVKWVEPYNLHVTLKFIGETDEKNFAAVENIMNGVFKKIKPFDVSFRGCGVFPNTQSPRVVWVGIGEGEQFLKSITEKLNDTLAMLNVPSEEWRFAGHLTLGRIKGRQGVGSLLQSLGEVPEDTLGSMTVDNVELMESKLSSSGPEYRILRKVSLGG